MAEFAYEDLLPIGADETPYRKLSDTGVRTVEGPDGRTFLQVDPEALTLLAETAMHDIAHYLRPAHLAQLKKILDDPEASNNDKFVALDLLKNANISAGGVLPMCQDTGTAIVMGKRGQHVLTAGVDEEPLSRGVYNAYTKLNLRYSQNAPITMFEEKNTGNNLPAQIELYADTIPGHENDLQVPVHGQGRRLGEQELPVPGDQGDPQPGQPHDVPGGEDREPRDRGLPAVPPGRSSSAAPRAEFALKTAKYASAKYLDTLPTEGDPATGHGFRDLEPRRRCWS
jgi:fumarate hydratase class I